MPSCYRNAGRFAAKDSLWPPSEAQIFRTLSAFGDLPDDVRDLAEHERHMIRSCIATPLGTLAVHPIAFRRIATRCPSQEYRRHHNREHHGPRW
jgi:hypothetical protein